MEINQSTSKISGRAELDDIVKVESSGGFLSWYQTCVVSAMNDLNKKWSGLTQEEKQVYELKLEKMKSGELETDGIEDLSSITAYDLFMFEGL